MAFTPSLATSGGTQQGLGYPGGLADGTQNIIDSAVNENATAIDIGVPVARGAATTHPPFNARPFVADTDDILGISHRHAADLVADPTTNVINFARYITFSVVRVGRVYAVAAENVRAGDQVLIITAGANVNSTCFGSSVSGVAAAGRVAFKGARWRTTTASGLLGIIELIDQNLGKTTT